jgi:hypothetical protein
MDSQIASLTALVANLMIEVKALEAQREEQ